MVSGKRYGSESIMNHGNHGTKSILGNGKTTETMVIMGNRVGTTVTMGKKGRLCV